MNRPFFKHAIVRLPSTTFVYGLTSSNLGIPDYSLALKQHSKYTETLKALGLEVKVLPANDSFPDSTFIEDVALCSSSFAVITNPGAKSRRGETTGMKKVLKEYYNTVEEITHPGTVEAGDIMSVGDLFYIGISGRTNSEGADQMIDILKRHKARGIKVPLKKMLHLKSGVSYLENNILLVSGEFIHEKLFSEFIRIEIDEEEQYAANSLWINGKILVPAGFPETRAKIEKTGLETIVLDVSEFRKLDGGLSCLSLRF
jgi:dimethylargininase